jgi:Flp pilus assembly protein TadG
VPFRVRDGRGILGRPFAQSCDGRPRVLRTRARRARAAAADDRGAAMVEFALVLPLLLALLIGTFDFGKAINYWVDETHLAAEGARFAVVNKNPGSGVSLQQYIKQQADTSELRNGGPGVDGTGAEVCISFPSGGTTVVGDPVQVRVRSTYHWVLGGLLALLDPTSTFSATTELSGTATMRLEALPTNYSASCFSGPVG